MEGGPALIRFPMKSVTEIDGEMNGKRFKVVGEGICKKAGDMLMHAHCVDGDLPFDWHALASSLQYGFVMFTEYPNGIYDWFKEQFPDGYTVERTQTYKGEDTGVITSRHEYSLEGDTMTAKCQFKGEGFDPTGPVMTKKIADILPAMAPVVAHDDNSVRLYFYDVHVLNDGKKMYVEMDSRFRTCNVARSRLPLPHFHVREQSFMKDDTEKRDHLVHREMVKAVDVHRAKSAL